LGILATGIIAIDLYTKNPTWEKHIIPFALPIVSAVGVWILTILPAPKLFAELQIMLLEAKWIAPSALARMWNSSWIDQLFLLGSILSLILVIFAARTIRYNYKRFVWIITALTISAVVIGKEQLYLPIATPFLYLQLLLTYLHSSGLMRKLSVFLLLTLACCHLAYNGLTLKQSYTSPINYYSYADSIYRAVPKGSWVLLAAHPDPYFYLRLQPDIHIMEFPFQIVPPNTYDAMFAKADYIVANMENDMLSTYVRQHVKETMRILSPNGVPTYIFNMR
jgi:hypothetical protein